MHYLIDEPSDDDRAQGRVYEAATRHVPAREALSNWVTTVRSLGNTRDEVAGRLSEWLLAAQHKYRHADPERYDDAVQAFLNAVRLNDEIAEGEPQEPATTNAAPVGPPDPTKRARYLRALRGLAARDDHDDD